MSQANALVLRMKQLLSEHKQLVVQLAKLDEDLLATVAQTEKLVSNFVEDSGLAANVPGWVELKKQAEQETFKPIITKSEKPMGERCHTCGSRLARKGGKEYCFSCQR